MRLQLPMCACILTAVLFCGCHDPRRQVVWEGRIPYTYRTDNEVFTTIREDGRLRMAVFFTAPLDGCMATTRYVAGCSDAAEFNQQETPAGHAGYNVERPHASGDIIVIRDRDGKEVARMPITDGRAVIIHSLDDDRVQIMNGVFVTETTRNMSQEQADWLVATSVFERDASVLDEMREARNLGALKRWIADHADVFKALSNQGWRIGEQNTQFLCSTQEYVVLIPDAAPIGLERDLYQLFTLNNFPFRIVVKRVK